MHIEAVPWVGWADTDSNQAGLPWGNWGQAANAPVEPWQTCYNDVPQIWSIDMRGIAGRFPGWFLDGVLVETWSRKIKHSERHNVTILDYFAPSWQQNPNSQPYSSLFRCPGIADTQYVWTSKNGVSPRQSTHMFYRPVPIEQYWNSPLYIAVAGDPNSRRTYGYARLLGFSLFRNKPGFPGSVANVLAQNGRAVPGPASQLVAGNWLSSFRGGREYLP